MPSKGGRPLFGEMTTTEQEVRQDIASRLETIRHSAAHIMAEAVSRLFPGAKFGIGPAIESGFYYDFELARALTPEDLPQIEAEMAKIIKDHLSFAREEISRKKALSRFANQPYKLELINEIPDENVIVYKQGSFEDLCRGPHIANSGQVKAFKLLSIAGAYWRGDEKRPMLQRIYGTAFESKAELDDYLKKLEEAARRDHRRLGRELDLFSVNKEAGPGLVLWHPKGATIRRLIEDFWKTEHIKRGYEIVYTPHIAKLDLWKTSGHWDFYREYLYSPMDIEGEQYIIKPMNCVFHIMIYQSRLRSYRELPIRYAELGTVYRYERSGVLHGLSRVRGFTQDDAHIFCRFDQLGEEVSRTLELALFMSKTFGFKNFKVMLSTRPDKFTGTPENWELATRVLAEALKRQRQEYEIDPGEGVFYGPKIDIKFEDAIGRAWQGPTIQVDFNLPQKFNVNYVGYDGKEQPVAMIHRTVLGSMERFMASLTEHYGGAFPVWLAPVQVVLIPIADRHLEYAQSLAEQLNKDCIRVEVDSRQETVNQKIRQAQMGKVPYMLVVGDREVAAGIVSVRRRDGSQQSEPFTEFRRTLKKRVRARSLED